MIPPALDRAARSDPLAQITQLAGPYDSKTDQLTKLTSALKLLENSARRQSRN